MIQYIFEYLKKNNEDVEILEKFYNTDLPVDMTFSAFFIDFFGYNIFLKYFEQNFQLLSKFRAEFLFNKQILTNIYYNYICNNCNIEDEQNFDLFPSFNYMYFVSLKEIPENIKFYNLKNKNEETYDSVTNKKQICLKIINIDFIIEKNISSSDNFYLHNLSNQMYYIKLLNIDHTLIRIDVNKVERINNILKLIRHFFILKYNLFKEDVLFLNMSEMLLDGGFNHTKNEYNMTEIKIDDEKAYSHFNILATELFKNELNMLIIWADHEVQKYDTLMNKYI